MKYSIPIASLLFSTLTLIISGCAGQPAPAEPVVINKNLPQVKINGYLSDSDAVAFEWKPATDAQVKGIRIYRDNPAKGDTNLYRIASINDTLHTHYIDSGLSPATAYRYRFTSVDAKGRESMPEETITAKTMPLPDPVSFFTATKELARGAKLLWRPHPDLRVNTYIIERLDPGAKNFRQIDSVVGRLNAEYIDEDLDDNKVYRYRILARNCKGEMSPPSAVVTVATKPLPLSPDQLTASRGKIRMIMLEWSASPTKKIAHYNLYRATSKEGYYDYYAKVSDTHFIDRPKEDGMHFFYKVTAVDPDGLESLPSAPAGGTTLAPPAVPELTSVTVKNNAAVIRWQTDDPRAVAFELHKTTRSGWFDSKEAVIHDIKTTTFTDVNIAPGLDYSYAVLAIDANGLKSPLSQSKSIQLEGQ